MMNRVAFLIYKFVHRHPSGLKVLGCKKRVGLRVISSSTTDTLLTTAFLNTDGKIAVVILNLSDQAQPFNLWLDGKATKTSSPAHSIITMVIS
jgi:O-glycosyl hydrolase